MFEGYEDFDFKTHNYEYTQQDLEAYESLKLDISIYDFEKIIDTFEKVAKIENNQSCEVLIEHFYKTAKNYNKNITP